MTAKHVKMSSSEDHRVAVYGNEAGDLDSIVSALGAAHLLRSLGVPATAVCSFPRAEFRLRNDAVEVFKRAGWELDAFKAPVRMTFVDEVSPSKRVAITDHNAWPDPTAEVVAVFDHHEDQGKHLDASPRVVDTKAGSTCSLIVNAMDDAKLAVPPELASLLETTIIIDTRNGKLGGEIDERALKVLKSDPNKRALLFQEIWKARHDVSSFSVEDLLRLDYKELVVDGMRAGFAAVFEPMDAFVARGNIETECRAFLDAKRLNLLVAITAEAKTAEGLRGLVVCSGAADSRLASDVILGLQACPKGLSSEFLSSPLSVQQGIPSLGFGIRPDTTVAPTSTLSAWFLRGPITRKTLLPAALEVLIRAVKRV